MISTCKSQKTTLNTELTFENIWNGADVSQILCSIGFNLVSSAETK
jgi:hypothetical protein